MSVNFEMLLPSPVMFQLSALMPADAEDLRLMQSCKSAGLPISQTAVHMHDTYGQANLRTLKLWLLKLHRLLFDYADATV